MKVAVAGLWHLGCVTAACLANAEHEVFAYDPSQETINNLQAGVAPISEPGLDKLLLSGNITFTADLQSLAHAELVWVTYDTPVDDNDIADVAMVLNEIKAIIAVLQNPALILMSSQIPVGTTGELQQFVAEHHADKKIRFAVSPENLRLGKAIEVFTKPDRVIVGLEDEADKKIIQELLKPFTENIVWMSVASAEMTKHALNAFLATSVVFINELSTLCERVGANAREVERGLKTEDRIGPKAYLRPGNAIAGGTLARDVNYLIQLGEKEQLETPLFSSLLESNHAHKQWSARRMQEVLLNLRDKTIATLGLSYKVGSDTLRRSTAVEMGEWLKQQGANVVAYDPLVTLLPEHLLNVITLKPSLEAAIAGADAILVTTEWPEFTALTAEQLLAHNSQPVVFDASGFLMKTLGQDPRIRYYSVGNAA